jgi:glycerol-3-phosphate dehydrogenase
MPLTALRQTSLLQATKIALAATIVAQMQEVFITGVNANGCEIACDEAGRGLTVMLANQGDLALATSTASTKLVRGGQRYPEYSAFRHVGEVLKVYETLLTPIPHISRPMRFELPYYPDRRFEGDKLALV